MNTTEIILIVIALAVLGLSLYRRYIKKDKRIKGSQQNQSHGSSFPSSSQDDDYEPYSNGKNRE